MILVVFLEPKERDLDFAADADVKMTENYCQFLCLVSLTLKGDLVLDDFSVVGLVDDALVAPLAGFVADDYDCFASCLWLWEVGGMCVGEVWVRW